jgi:membrane protease subunit HflK
MADKKNPWARGGNNSGGSGSGGTGGTPPSSGGNKPGRDYERLLREQHDRVKSMFGGHEGRLIPLVLGALALLWVASGVYRVNSDELGVVMRFGKYSRTTTPGLNYHLPVPIETVIIPSVTTVNKVEIGRGGTNADNPSVRQARAAFADRAMPQLREGQMLTGDRNIVDVDFEVQWKIDASAPERFLFNMRDPASNVKSVAESAMREVIGRNKLDDILTSAQSQIAEDTKQIMQEMFDRYDAGVEIIAVNLSRPDVPQPVIDEFQDVKRAEQDKQTAESVAEGYANEIIPKAKGEAAKMNQDAEAYKSKVIADAEGDAARYNQIYTQYALAKDVTKKRMYLETMEQVLKGMPKMVIDSKAQGNGGMMQWVPTPAPRNTTPAPAPAAQ